MSDMLKSWWSGSAQSEETGDTEAAGRSNDSSEAGDGASRDTGDSGDARDTAVSGGSVSSWVKGFGELVSTVGDYAHTIRDTVSTTVQSNTILNEFDVEQKKFEKERQRQRDTAVPPWVGFNEEEQIKSQIMELSSDSRNVLRDPPPGIQFHFEFAKSYPIALTLLKEDQRLQKLRFELVPKKLKEERFWHNYFYRVFLIKQSSQLASMTSAEHHSTSSPVLPPGDAGDVSTTTPPSATAPAPTFPQDTTDHPTQDDGAGDDFASDALVVLHQDGGGEGGGAISRESVRAELDQLGVEEELRESGGAGGEEWDEELLAKELEDLGLEGVGEQEGGVQDEQWEEDLKLMLESHSTDQL